MPAPWVGGSPMAARLFVRDLTSGQLAIRENLALRTGKKLPLPLPRYLTAEELKKFREKNT